MGAVTVVVTGTIAAFAAGAVDAAAGAAEVPVTPAFETVAFGPKVTRHVPVFAIGAGARGGFPTSHTVRLEC